MHPGQSSARLQGAFLLHRQRYVVVFLSAMMAIMALLATPEAQAQSPAPTTTTLALSDSSGLLSSGSSVTAGTVVTFTATVINTSPVTTGLVTFCDFATATYCDNSALIGTAQLTSAGTAIISLVPGMGNHSYVAVFNGTPYGTPANAASTSSLQALTVTGYRTTTSISASGSAGSYTLTGTVVGWGNSNVGPTGSVSFMDATNSDYVLGMATLGTATSAAPFAANSPSPYATGNGPHGVAVGDFNGDGIPDLAVANYASSTVSILLGSGDGTFTVATTLSSSSGGFNGPVDVAVGDFDGDGNLDLAVANYANNSVSIMLGNGEGTFTAASGSPYTTGFSGPRSVAVGDFNGDGLPDLAVANFNNSTVTVLLNNVSDPGTFVEAPGSPFGGAEIFAPRSVAVGDFNGDGWPDLAVANYGTGTGTGTVTVLLNKANGAGTFAATTYNPYAAGSAPTYVAVGDFNGDGKPDLVVTNGGSNNMSVLLNIYSGTGTDPFATSASSTFPTYETGSTPWAVAIGDLNGDGNADLAVANCSSSSPNNCYATTVTGTVSVLLGNGAGAFCDATDTDSYCANFDLPNANSYSVGAGPVHVAVGDFNGDGLADLAVTNYDDELSGGVNVLLNGVTQTATATTASAVAVPGTGGSDNVEASYAGDSNFAPSTLTRTALTSSSAALSITASSTSMTYGGTVPPITPLYTYYNGTANVVNSPTAPSGTTTPSCTTTVTSSSPVGTYIGANTCSVATSSTFTNISYVAGTMTVTQATLTITASSGTMTYGGTPPAVTASYSAFAGSDTVNSLTTAPTCTTTASSSTPAGTDTGADTCSGAVDPNYSFTYVAGNVTVGTGSLSITASNGSMTYGGTPPTVTPSYSGFVNGNTAASLTTAPTCTTTASSSTPAGTDTGANTCSGAVDPNYSFTYVAGNVTVGTASLTITASSGTMTYGGTPPTVTPSYSGFVNGNTAASLTTAPTCATAATSSTPAGTDTGADTCAGAVDPNYTISYVAGNVTVGTVPLSITASSGTMTYGGTPPAVTPSYSGFVNGDTAASLTAAPTCMTAATSSTPVGTDAGADTCAGAVDPNYTISYVPGNVTVGTVPLSITASSGTMTYGGTPPTVTPSYSGFVNGDTGASLTAAPTCTTAATSSTPAGTDTGANTCSGAVDPNYSFTYVAGNVTINAASLTITASSGSMTYGGTPPTVTPSYSGFVNGNTGASLTTAPTCATAATSSTPAGTDTGADTCAGAVDTNYTISYVPGNVTVGTVPLSITASSGTMTYGGTPPTVTPSYSGFVNGDTAASLTAAPTCTTAATSSTPVGTDAGADTCAGAVDPNYSFTYVAGNVTVNAASLTITASSGTMTYGGTPPTVAPLYTYGAVVNSSTPPSGMTTLPTCTTSASSSTPAGTDTGADTCTGAVDPDYTISYAPGNATVNKATPVITWATPAAITYGTALSSTQLDATASVAGTFVYSPAAGTTPAAGTDTLSATFTPNDATDYNTATASVTLAVADFTFGASSGSSTTATVAPGSSATYTLSVGSEGGFNQSVTFTCAGAPSEATCTVSPSPAAAGTKVTVTVTTTAPSLSAPRSRPLPPAPPLSTGLRNLLLLSLVLAAMACAFSRRKQIGTRRWKGAFLPLAAGMLLALALAGCGGGGGSVTPPPNGGTPAGTYPLTVTGSTGSGSSALSHSVTLTLTVS